MRRTPALAVAVALSAVLLASCSHDPKELVTTVTSDRIALCGGGLRLSSNVGLSAVINRELASGKITARTQTRLEAAFIEHLGGSESEAIQAYERYIACVEGKENLDATVAEISERATKLVGYLRSKHLPESDIQAIEALRVKEQDELRDMQFLQARDTRAEITHKIVEIAMANKIDPSGIDFALSERPTLSNGELEDRENKAWAAVEDEAIRACSLYAPKEQCKATAQAELLIKRAERANCNTPETARNCTLEGYDLGSH
jgi:hypothetical protein